MVDRQQLVKPLAGVLLLAAVVMFASMFTPFVTQPCIMCPDITSGSGFVFPSWSLIEGHDGWLVLCVVAGLALAAESVLMSLRRRIAPIACLVITVSALALSIFEGFDAGNQVIGWGPASLPVEFGPHGPIPYVPARALVPSLHLDFGFYLFLGAAVVAVVVAAFVVTIDRANRDRGMSPRSRSLLPSFRGATPP